MISLLELRLIWNLSVPPIGINLLRCTLSSYEAVITVSLNQPAYKTYTQFLPAYMAAYYTQSRCSIMSPYYPLRWKSSDPIFSNQLPDVSVSFSNVPASELLETLRSNGARELSVKGSKVFIIPSPTPALLKTALAGGAIKTTPAAVNSANINSLATLGLVRRIFSNFFFTHQYPAFADSAHLEYVEDHWQQGKDDKRKSRAAEQEARVPRKRIQTAGGVGLDTEGDDIMLSEEEEEVPMSNKIVNAIPPPRIHDAWGDETSAPQNHGIFARYVEETQNGKDEKAVHDTITRYFLGCLGESAEAVRASYDRIKGDLGIIMMTTQGKELAHVAKCIDIGLQSQARIWPLISGDQYLGCVFLGAGYQISSYGTVYVPVAPETLLQRIEQAGSHRSAINAIANIVDDDAASQNHLSIQGVQSMNNLRQVLRQAHLSAEDRDRIVALARGLRFKPKSQNVSAENLSEAFRYIQYPDEALPSDYPISPNVLFEENRTLIVWSVFGDLAPTCSFPGGAQVNLESSKDLPKHIGFRLIPLKDAVIDIEMILSQKKFSNSTLNRRSGAYKDRLYTGLDASKIFSAITSAVGVVVDKGKKKDAGAGNVDPGLFDEGF